MAGVEQNRYKTNNGRNKHLPQTGYWTSRKKGLELIELSSINEVSLVYPPVVTLDQ